MTEQRDTRRCPFCEGGGLRPSGQGSCTACGGSGRWEDAAFDILKDARSMLVAHDNPYRQASAILDLVALLPPRQVGT